MGSDTSTLAPVESETTPADLDWTEQERDLLDSLDITALSLSPEARDDPKGFFRAAIPSLDETAIIGASSLSETDRTGSSKVSQSDKMKRPIAIRSAMPRIDRHNSDPNIASLTPAQLADICAEVESQFLMSEKGGSETPVHIVPQKPGVTSGLYHSLSAKDMTEDEKESSRSDRLKPILESAALSSSSSVSEEPLKEKLMRMFSTSMKMNCIGVLFGDESQSTIPMIESLSPRSVMYSVSNMSASVTMSEADERFEEKDEAEYRNRKPQWRGVFVVGNYKCESSTEGAMTMLPSIHTLRTEGFGIGDSADPDGMPALAALSTALVSQSTRLAAPITKSGSGSGSDDKITRTVSIGVPKELVKSSLSKGATKREKKQVKKAIKRSPVVSRLLRTYCYDSYDKDLVFFGETMSFEVMPCFYRDRGTLALSEMDPSEVKMAEMESRIHPQILFELFDREQTTLTTKRKKKAAKKKGKGKKKKTKADLASVLAEEEYGDSDDDDFVMTADPSSIRTHFISMKPGSLLVYIMQDLTVVRQAEESEIAATASSKSKKKKYTSGGGSSRSAAGTKRAAMVPGFEDVDDDGDGFGMDIQSSHSMRARTRTDASAMIEIAQKKKARKKAVKKGTVGMQTRKVAVGFVRVANLLDRVTMAKETTQSSTALLQIPLYPVLERDVVRMVSLVMSEYDIHTYSDFLDSPHLRHRSHFARSELINPPSIGSLICSVHFDWAG